MNTGSIYNDSIKVEGIMIVEENRTYIAIDLKSFYASVECRERGLDPLTTNLVVADRSRTNKTICLAVSPSLKSYGVPGRPRLFEVVKRIDEVNAERRLMYGKSTLNGSSYDNNQLLQDKTLAVDYIVAPPRMAFYMDYSTRIYKVYLKYVAPEDMHIYSIDEVFMDVTHYLRTYKMTPEELTMTIIKDVLSKTGITATAGIGSNMYLCKIAMDIVAKHMEADENGVRMARLDEMSYRRLLWGHKPLTDFWRVGRGIAKKLEENGMYTMGDVARCSVGRKEDYYNEDFLYKLFGVNAELLIDHAWGYEPCTIEMIKAYKPETNSLSSGQVLSCPYNYEDTRLVVKEMTDLLVLDLVDKELITDQMVLTIGYDIENTSYKGELTVDRYGRKVPKHAHGTINLKCKTHSTSIIMDAVMELFDRIVDKNLLIRRITIAACRVVRETEDINPVEYEQMDLFTDYSEREKEREKENIILEKEKNIQKAMLDIKKKYGKNAILRGMNLQEGATAVSRNSQIGGHKA